jgi:hypothetical protein
VQQLEPVFDREDLQVFGAAEECLLLAVVHGERAGDHHEVQIGVAPIDQRVAEYEERERRAGDEGGKTPALPGDAQPVERVLAFSRRGNG